MIKRKPPETAAFDFLGDERDRSRCSTCGIRPARRGVPVCLAAAPGGLIPGPQGLRGAAMGDGL